MSWRDRTLSPAVSTIAYRIRRSSRARRVRVTVDPAHGVEVVLPARAPERAADAAVIELRPWIERRVAEIERLREQIAARGDTVPYLGSQLRLVPQAGRTRVGWRPELDELLVPLDAAERRAALERWYRRRARVEVTARLDAAGAAAGLHYRGLTVRAQKTRWASCSREGAMSFNWRLLLAPEPVLDYVVWHEVCHLKVMDHSPRFWALVARWCPGYREQVRWLRRHGATLVL
ncbi:MAG TPA: SprT family zinc-dependent metalloprotease [Solirubrobacteraceae bacterium]|nr:SprT family zinc-dependent metalloprotease [Solirubrobacteraceae bacterium]